jgi:hypothetical protein
VIDGGAIRLELRPVLTAAPRWSSYPPVEAVALDAGAAPSVRAPSVRPRRVEAPRVPDGLKASPYQR